MKILITTDWYVSATNGVVISVQNLCGELKRRGHDVRILTLSSSEESYCENGVYYVKSFSFHKIYPGVRGTFDFRNKYIDELICWKPDIIHSQCEFFTFQFAKRIAKKTDAPIIHTYHTLYEHYVGYVIPFERLGKYLIGKMVKWRLKNVDSVIVPTQKVEKYFKKYGIDKQIYIVPTGIDLERYQWRMKADIRQKKRNEYGISEDDFVLLSLGRLGIEKNMDELFVCFSWVLQENNNMVLMIVGDGPYREELKEWVEYLDIGNKVIFTGMVEASKVQEFYQLGDVFVSSSISETQGLTYIEAAASGLPLVCREDSCLQGIILNGVNGFEYTTLDEFEEQILTLQQNCEFRSNAAKKSEEIANGFGKMQFAENIEQIYYTLYLKNDEKIETRNL